MIWFHAPHLPCVAGPQQVALYKDLDLQQRNYYGCITALDEQIGRLVDYLKAKNIYENSIILFCSDNGPELETPGSPGNFRGKNVLFTKEGYGFHRLCVGRRNWRKVVNWESLALPWIICRHYWIS